MESAPRSKKGATEQPAKKTDSQGRYVIVRVAPGKLEKRAWQKGDHELIGAFTGKVGSMRRSSKGRTSRMPNGHRSYDRPWVQEVVAYKA